MHPIQVEIGRIRLKKLISSLLVLIINRSVGNVFCQGRSLFIYHSIFAYFAGVAVVWCFLPMYSLS